MRKKFNKNKTIVFIMLSIVICFFVLIFMPSYSLYFTDNSGSLMLSGQASFTYNFLNNMVASKASTSGPVVNYNNLNYNGIYYNAGYRYVTNNADNYVWFNCKDTDSSGNSYGTGGYSYTTSCEKWRIISVERGNQLGFTGDNSKKYYTRIIRELSIGKYNWSDTETNNWSASTLYTYLNGDYYNGMSTIAKNMITTARWFTTGPNDSTEYDDDTVGQWYYNERNGSVSNSAYPKYVDANVGMAYPSDVGLSAPVTCKNTAIIDGFSGTECATNNWLTTIPDPIIPTLTPMAAAGETGHIYILSSGLPSSYQGAVWPEPVYPNVYLNADTIVRGGTGSSASPFVLAIPDQATTFSYTGDYQEFVAPKKGYYFIETYGAKGAGYNNNGGNGGYASGYIYLAKNEVLYVYVGNMGSSSTGGYNGGGNGSYANSKRGYGGGGATDIRCFYNSSTGMCESTTENLTWNSAIGLNNRIMVAGGGGGGTQMNSYAGGTGGGLSGGAAAKYSSGSAVNGGTQVSGGNFGIGTNANTPSYNSNGAEGRGGGGGGWYGGHARTTNGKYTNAAGAGGSGYISGQVGCVAIASGTDTAVPRTVRTDSAGTACASGTGDVVCSYHFSGKKFENTQLISAKNAAAGKASIKYIGASVINQGELENERSFDYTGGIQTLKITKTGYYLLEVWGAAGTAANGKAGGFGGYSRGVARLTEGEYLYVVVGGMGGVVTGNGQSASGGYNGGGSTKIAGHSGTHYSGAGGGATHIATVSGILKNLSGYRGTASGNTYVSDKILIVAGGGGGGAYHQDSNYGTGGNAGGFKGNQGYSNGGEHYGTGGTQTAAGTAAGDSQGAGGFGYGGNVGASGEVNYGGGGGGGWYGGGGAAPARYSGGGGGSSYIGSSRLISYNGITKAMYCYGCTTSTAEDIYTIKTTSYSSSPIVGSAKSGTGYAMVTFLG